MSRTIVGITGIRSEYDILYEPYRAISNHQELDLKIIVSGAHLSDSFGYTVKEIEADGFEIADRIQSLLDTDSRSGRIKSAAVQLQGLIQTLERVKPDFILVAGDREEVVVAALAGVYMEIPVAHLAGGDFGGKHVDDLVRDATTKLAHIHFPATEEHAKRIMSMKEEPWRIHCIGAPALDRFSHVEELSRKELGNRLDFDMTSGPVLLLIQHVLPAEWEEAEAQMRITMNAIAELGIKTLISYPNTDAGGREIIKVIDEFAPELPFVKTYKNLPRLEFVNLLRSIDVILGNSTTGIQEAPFLKLPAVNIGNRQRERQHGNNVIFVPNDVDAIKSAINTALYDEDFKKKVEQGPSPFGDGHASEKIAEILANVSINKDLIYKKIVY